jgi:WXG100 family type VII secretion target
MSGLGDYVSMNFADVQTAASNFEQKVSDFDAASTAINTAAQNLMDTWKGSGSQAFDAAVQKWRHDMQLISSDLQAITDTMTKASIAVSNTDQDISKAFSGFQG